MQGLPVQAHCKVCTMHSTITVCILCQWLLPVLSSMRGSICTWRHNRWRTKKSFDLTLCTGHYTQCTQCLCRCWELMEVGLTATSSQAFNGEEQGFDQVAAWTASSGRFCSTGQLRGLRSQSADCSSQQPLNKPISLTY